MLQKLSKCEVKADFVEIDYFTATQILANSNSPKMSFLAISETLKFEFLANLGFESCSNSLKSKFRTSKIAKNYIFGLFEITKIGFHVNSEWR